MANISITTECNSSCPYCFTHSVIRTDQNRFMKMEVFVRALDFLDRSGIGQVRILGGEPTLHPEFTDFITTALERKKEIRIFTNGNIPDHVLEFLSGKRHGNISYLVNLSDFSADAGNGRIEKTLSVLGNRAMPGINLYHADQDISFLLPLMKACNMKKSIRLGIAHPGTGISNISLLPKQYMQAGKKIISFALSAGSEDIRIIPDCGLVPCMFGGDIPAGIPVSEWNIGKSCSPITDILPDGSIIPCYPLASVCREQLDSSATASSVIALLADSLFVYRSIGIFRECETCRLFRSGGCTGGCRAAAIRRLHEPDFAIMM